MAGGDFFHAALFKEFFDVFLSGGFGFIAFGVEYLVKLEDIVILSDFDRIRNFAGFQFAESVFKRGYKTFPVNPAKAAALGRTRSFRKLHGIQAKSDFICCRNT